MHADVFEMYLTLKFPPPVQKVLRIFDLTAHDADPLKLTGRCVLPAGFACLQLFLSIIQTAEPLGSAVVVA